MGLDLYNILGVPPTATQEEIRTAYRALAKAFHPDRFAERRAKARAEAQLKAINAAYGVLGDPERRRQYDAARVARPAPAPPLWDALAPVAVGLGAAILFSPLFEAAERAARRRREAAWDALARTGREIANDITRAERRRRRHLEAATEEAARAWRRCQRDLAVALGLRPGRAARSPRRGRR